MTDLVATLHKHSYATISPGRPDNSASDTTVLVTGATSGLGLEIAKSFVLAKAKHVILTGRTEDRLKLAVEQLQTTTDASQTRLSTDIVDINSSESIVDLWKRLEVAGVYVDTLVLNAASNETPPDILDIDWLSEAIATNFLNQLRFSAHFLRQTMPAVGHRRKTLLAVSSGTMHMYPYPRSAAYPTSKLALSAYLARVADQIPETECRIISFHPGTVLSEAMIKHGVDPVRSGLPFNDADLPANFCVWAAGNNDAASLHGSFVWATWDVDELLALKRSYSDDPGFLRPGLQGCESVDSRTVFSKIFAHKEFQV
ncbi:NAD(P)-binding protein [Myriangium duriaei CBS 260.36]|uniref:NAD(P)-binding protein n=1 Tax=Myriangium duriaei CBS 260.36 TaxID=1168546 RepID=A0A9P4MPW8_9PEZI|nr:NAD(P)-binding protein [Myriangium duriaei CBS 260.36]